MIYTQNILIGCDRIHIWFSPVAPDSLLPITLVISSVARVGPGAQVRPLYFWPSAPFHLLAFLPRQATKMESLPQDKVTDMCSYSLTFFCFHYVGGVRQGLMCPSLVLSWLGRLVLKTRSSCCYFHVPGAKLTDIVSQAQLILKSFDLLG